MADLTDAQIWALAEYYETHCTVCRLEFVDGTCPPCPMDDEVEPWHGTPGGYTNHKCRGPLCRAAHAWAQQKARERRARETPFGEIPHGLNGYNNYHCRCTACTDAKADYSALERERLLRRGAAARRAGGPEEAPGGAT